jgi:hypothetical protein
LEGSGGLVAEKFGGKIWGITDPEGDDRPSSGEPRDPEVDITVGKGIIDRRTGETLGGSTSSERNSVIGRDIELRSRREPVARENGVREERAEPLEGISGIIITG